ncbi:hypothetical protein JZ751_017470 [Albula glossodonta]|uniref:Uncharacterized protein n=1 Tax=Albula glossodonta TaxID=121402 RepID=A0A8T2PJY9_9TELE|nr:hypothetical protein JZ751_017470 [Albula glossodonta]
MIIRLGEATDVNDGERLAPTTESKEPPLLLQAPRAVLRTGAPLLSHHSDVNGFLSAKTH